MNNPQPDKADRVKEDIERFRLQREALKQK